MDLFNAYQQTHGPKVENALKTISGDGYVASFVGREAGRAVFVGLFAVKAFKSITYKQYWRIPEYQELKALGMKGWSKVDEDRSSILHFHLEHRSDFYSDWKGKMVIEWPGPEISWWRRAHKNKMPIHAIHEESVFDPKIVEWDRIDFTWSELQIIPSRLKAKLKEWKGVYYIFDVSDSKGYVGATYGKGNLFQRWDNYAATGHGGNNLLRNRNRDDFRFTILQRVSPDMEDKKLQQLEATWKRRLHTRSPLGLNDGLEIDSNDFE